jgi:phytanoyl-CoA dioxygenase PhyH
LIVAKVTTDTAEWEGQMKFTASVPTLVSRAAKTALGALAFNVQGRTPPFAYRNMLELFVKTGGVSNDAMSSLLAMMNPPYEFPSMAGVLGDLSTADVEAIGASIRERGYHVFEQRLSGDLCDQLLEMATTRPCVQRFKDGEAHIDVELRRFPRENPNGVRYDFTDDLIDDPLIQGLMADRSIVAVAQSYLQSRPVIDIVAMWWNVASPRPDKQAAQFWHFDMDRIKWLKFFVYLTEVGPDNGPHSFVEGSHRTGGIAPDLLEKGYMRLTDEEVAKEYPAEKLVEFTGPRGTIIAEDTRGLHKGKHVFKNDRLILQFQLCNSLFGGEYPKRTFSGINNEQLKVMKAAYPRVYSNYV